MTNLLIRGNAQVCDCGAMQGVRPIHTAAQPQVKTDHVATFNQESQVNLCCPEMWSLPET